MPKLPTKEEAQLSEEQLLEKLWDEVGTAEDPSALFAALGAIIATELSLHSRIHITQAMVGYCYTIRSMLEADEMVEARRLVRAIRREVADLQKCLARFERQQAGTRPAAERKMRARAWRECWAIYQNAQQHGAQFERLSGYPIGFRCERLDQIEDAVSEAMWKIAPPFVRADCQGALAILDGVLDRWSDVTNSKKGRAFRSKALSDMIRHLENTFQDATGRLASAPRSGFQSFVRRILGSLSAGVYNSNGVTDAALPKRIREISASS